ncbi:MAG: DUF1294 domain-containing protein [Verrucomicrobia bacterium]|nr:MAG: DUF1294 domain-containing protein [Verrucomicrobiota bacterium]
MRFLAALHAVASVVTFVVYWADKRRAAKGGRRVPERVLQLLALAFGWPGALVAQHVLRHKNRKPAFQVLFWLIVAAHLGGWAWWLGRQR